MAGQSLQLEMLSDVDRTIDQLFEVYQANGQTELFEEMCPYFGTLWPAGKILANKIADDIASGEFGAFHPKGSRILEIGCGLALPSLLLAKAGWTVKATDLHPDVAAFLERNKKLNQTVGPEYLHLDWREETTVAQTWDLIIASDVLYDKTQPAALLRFLMKALSPKGRALVADPGRTYVDGFFTEAKRVGYQVSKAGMFGVVIGEIRRREGR
jgi:predicted nicotinamide N-methyase